MSVPQLEKSDVRSAHLGVGGRPAVPAGPSLAPVRYWAATTPDARFLTFEDLDGERSESTWAEFERDVDARAAEFAAAGLTAGDRCVLHTGNTPGFLSSLFGVLALGAVAVPTIAQYTADELRFVLEDSGARLLVAAPDLRSTAEEAGVGLACRLMVEDGMPATGLGAPGGPDAAPDPAGPSAPLLRDAGGAAAFVIYTSGTTSRPKGVVLTHAAAAFSGRSYAQHFRLQTGDTTLTCLPLFHVNALLLQMMPVVFSGGRLVVTPRFSASRFDGWLADHDVSVAHLVAGVVRMLLRGEPTTAAGEGRLRLVSFGMPLDDAEIAAFERRYGAQMTMIWGSTETGCGGTAMPLDHERRPGHQNIGKAMLGWEVAVAEPERDPVAKLPNGETGELLVRSPAVMSGYFGNPEATAATLREGWVATGDLGWRDEDGYFHFVDRLKDMIKPAGENVAAGEVERILLAHPGVLNCAVIGLPDPVRSEMVAAVLTRRSGSEVDAEELRAWCAERLAPFKVPQRFEFRDELPLTSIGKVRKAELRLELVGEAGR